MSACLEEWHPPDAVDGRIECGSVNRKPRRKKKVHARAQRHTHFYTHLHTRHRNQRISIGGGRQDPAKTEDRSAGGAGVGTERIGAGGGVGQGEASSPLRKGRSSILDDRRRVARGSLPPLPPLPQLPSRWHVTLGERQRRSSVCGLGICLDSLLCARPGPPTVQDGRHRE